MQRRRPTSALPSRRGKLPDWALLQFLAVAATTLALGKPFLNRFHPGSSSTRGRGGQRPACRATAEAVEGAGLVQQWRASRRERLLRSLDWSRYHLQVCFVDGSDPSYFKARLASFLFKRICRARGCTVLLCCEAGGLRPTRGNQAVDPAAVFLPGLDQKDHDCLDQPLEEFLPAHIHLYDAVLATDQETCDALRRRLSQEGLNADADHLCVLGDYLDAYDVMLAQEQENAQGLPTAKPSMAPGFVTIEGIRGLMDGSISPGPLRGRPQDQPVGPALGGLPTEWGILWSQAGDPNELQLGDAETPLERLQNPQSIGRLLRSAVGLQRSLSASIPEGMRWWNDEE